jgi:hypothetical protein
MACGDRYRYLAVTASGLNLSNASGIVPTFDDYEEWQDLADRLGLMAQQAADALAAVEVALTGTYVRWDAVTEVKTRMVDKLDALPDWYTGNVSSSIGEAQSAIFDALCVIEMSVDGIAHYGGPAFVVPGAPTPDPGLGLGGAIGSGIGTVALIGGLALAFVLVRRGRR